MLVKWSRAQRRWSDAPRRAYRSALAEDCLTPRKLAPPKLKRRDECQAGGRYAAEMHRACQRVVNDIIDDS